MFLISYRRDDTGAITGRICDRLREKFGDGFVFRDFDSIPLAVDFRTHISQKFQSCLAVVAIIGPRWAGDLAAEKRRIDDPKDFVHVEIGQALEMNVPIIPVLIDSTTLPVLPEPLQKLKFINSIRIDSGIDFDHHVSRLCHNLGVLTSPLQSALKPTAPFNKREDAPREIVPFSVRPYLGLPDAFRNVQKALIKEKLLQDHPDGVLGRNTLRAVKNFQKQYGLAEASGGLDKETINALFDWESRPASPINSEDQDLMRRYLRKPSFKRLSEQIKWLQQTLRRCDCYDGPIDGIVRPDFLESVREFQAKKHIEQDGCLGYETLLFAIEDEVNLRDLSAGV